MVEVQTLSMTFSPKIEQTTFRSKKQTNKQKDRPASFSQALVVAYFFKKICLFTFFFLRSSFQLIWAKTVRDAQKKRAAQKAKRKVRRTAKKGKHLMKAGTVQSSRSCFDFQNSKKGLQQGQVASTLTPKRCHMTKMQCQRGRLLYLWKDSSFCSLICSLNLAMKASACLLTSFGLMSTLPMDP